MTDIPLDDELRAMAGDPQLAKAIRRNLERLRDGAGDPDMAEMARDILEGRTDLRTVASSSAYSTNLSAAVATYQTWYSELGTEERAAFEEHARKAIYGMDTDGQP